MSWSERRLILFTYPETYAFEKKIYSNPQDAYLTQNGLKQASNAGRALHQHYPAIGTIMTDTSKPGLIAGRICDIYIKPEDAGHHHLNQAIPRLLKKEDPWTHFVREPLLDTQSMPETLSEEDDSLGGDRMIKDRWLRELPEIVVRTKRCLESIHRIRPQYDALIVCSREISLVMAALFGCEGHWDQDFYTQLIAEQGKNLGFAGVVDYKVSQDADKEGKYTYQLMTWSSGPYTDQKSEVL